VDGGGLAGGEWVDPALNLTCVGSDALAVRHDAILEIARVGRVVGGGEARVSVWKKEGGGWGWGGEGGGRDGGWRSDGATHMRARRGKIEKR